ncbi:hypothetical protein ACC740_38460, partial [Rhizobium ruizarguesonis]
IVSLSVTGLYLSIGHHAHEVAIGNLHGVSRGEPELEQSQESNRHQEISNIEGVLALHLSLRPQPFST